MSQERGSELYEKERYAYQNIFFLENWKSVENFFGLGGGERELYCKKGLNVGLGPPKNLEVTYGGRKGRCHAVYIRERKKIDSWKAICVYDIEFAHNFPSVVCYFMPITNVFYLQYFVARVSCLANLNVAEK